MLKKIFIHVLFAMTFIGYSSLSSAKTPVEKLKKFLAETVTLQADFKQVTLDENGSPVQSSNGLFYLSRPGQFRWSYQQPFVQEIISSNGKVWFYDTDLEQVTINKMDESLGSTPALLLSGDITLDDNFILQDQVWMS